MAEAAKAVAAMKVDSAAQNGNEGHRLDQMDHEEHTVSGSSEVNGSGTVRRETTAQAYGDATMEG